MNSMCSSVNSGFDNKKVPNSACSVCALCAGEESDCTVLGYQNVNLRRQNIKFLISLTFLSSKVPERAGLCSALATVCF